MAQYDVYENNGKNKNIIPYLLDIQSNILSDLKTRVVIPLGINKPYNKIVNPKIIVEAQEVIMMTPHLTSVDSSKLSIKVCSLENQRTTIINAIDFMVTGY